MNTVEWMLIVIAVAYALRVGYLVYHSWGLRPEEGQDPWR